MPGNSLVKRILSIQDISCVGRCSLTVALPVISAAGIETAILPTAVLSAHTAFDGFTFRDLTADLRPITEHWRRENIGFDGIYTGYLGTFEQIELVEEILERFRRPGQLRFVDPAMGDNGKLYTGFTPDFALRMAGLCGRADVIVPNLTEAAMMLGEDYPAHPDDPGTIRTLLEKLADLGCGTVILTGISYRPDRCGAVAYEKKSRHFTEYFSERIPMSFHGTGDVFASACFAALMRGQPLEKALRTAVEFTVAAIRFTVADPGRAWYGVDFEPVLPRLLELLDIPRTTKQDKELES